MCGIQTKYTTHSRDIDVKTILNKEERDSTYFMPELFNVYKTKQTFLSEEQMVRVLAELQSSNNFSFELVN